MQFTGDMSPFLVLSLLKPVRQFPTLFCSLQSFRVTLLQFLGVIAHLLFEVFCESS
jgi:hypothetical protein